MPTIKVLALLACAAIAAAGSRSSSRGYSTPTAGYGDSSYSSYKGSKSSYGSLPTEFQGADVTLGSSKVAKGILLSIRVVNPDESSGQPTYAAQVPIHFTGGRVTTGPVVYGREQPCPEDHVHGGRHLQSIVGGYNGGSRGGRGYSPSAYQNALSAAKSYSVSQQIQVGSPGTAKTFQYHGQSYAVPVAAVPATASQEDAKSYVSYASPSPAGGGPHYQQGYQVAHAPSSSYPSGAVSAEQAVGPGKSYTTAAYGNGHAYQVVAQGGDGQEHVYVTAHPGAAHGGHGGHGGPAGHSGHGGHGTSIVSQKSYTPYAVQDTYSVEASPGKSYSGEAGASGNAIGGQQVSYEVTDGAQGKAGYGGGPATSAYAAGPGYAGPSYGGGPGGASYSAVVGRGYAANGGPSYGGAGGPSYGAPGGYAKSGYQVSAYPVGQPTYGVNAAAFKAAAAGKGYGSYGGEGGEGQTIIVTSDASNGGEGGKSYGGYQALSAVGPSYSTGGGAQYKASPQQYGGAQQQSFSRYTDPSSFYSGSQFADANRAALQKYNALLSRAASMVGGPQNLKAVAQRYNIPWN